MFITEIKHFDAKQAKAMGNRIKEARKMKAMKQIQLAGELNISVDQMSNIENGRVVCKTEYIFLIEQILNISSEYLLHGNNEIYEKKDVIELLAKLSPDQIRRSKLILESAFL